MTQRRQAGSCPPLASSSSCRRPCPAAHTLVCVCVQVYARAVTVATTLGGFIARVAGDAALGQLEANAPLRAAQLRDTLGKLGPSFVKIGQALSARPDLLPKVRAAAPSAAAAVLHGARPAPLRLTRHALASQAEMANAHNNKTK